MRHKQLAILQGTSIPRCYGTATLNLNFFGVQLRDVEPKVVHLEYIPDTISLSDIIARPELAKSIQSSLAKSIKSIVSAFGRLGVVQHDTNPGNFLFSVKTVRSVVIDFWEAYHVREEEVDQAWRETVEGGDIDYTKFRLKDALGEQVLM